MVKGMSVIITAPTAAQRWIYKRIKMRIVSFILNIIAAGIWSVNFVVYTKQCCSDFNFYFLLMAICSIILTYLHIYITTI